MRINSDRNNQAEVRKCLHRRHIIMRMSEEDQRRITSLDSTATIPVASGGNQKIPASNERETNVRLEKK